MSKAKVGHLEHLVQVYFFQMVPFLPLIVLTGEIRRRLFFLIRYLVALAAQLGESRIYESLVAVIKPLPWKSLG